MKIRANSPGERPIVVVELPSGELRAAYYETGYELESAKPVGEDWLRENAIGRHSFLEASLPTEVPAAGVWDYVRRELLGET